MKALPISGIGNWTVAGAASLAGHVAVVAVIATLESTPSPEDFPPITVELVVLDEAKPEPVTPAGTPLPDHFQFDTSAIAMTRPSAPPAPNKLLPPDQTAAGKIDPVATTIFDTAPLETFRPNADDVRTYVSRPWSPPSAAVLLESTAQPRQEPSPASPSVTAAAAPDEIEAPKQIATTAPLGAPPIEPAQPAPVVRLPQPKPPTSQTDHSIAADLAELELNAVSTVPTDPSTPDVIIRSAEISKLVEPVHERVQVSTAVPDADLPSSGSALTRLNEEDEQAKRASTNSVQVAGAVQPIPKPAGVTRGVQVFAGNRPPKFPLAARRRGLEGRVLLRVEVDSGGVTHRISITKSSGHKILDEAARRAAGKWQFLPALVDGEAASGAIDVPIVFRLN